MTLSLAGQERLLARIRQICLALPETSERLSHGEPAFFFREKKSFLNMDAHHHGSSHYSAWVAAPMGSQDLLVRSDPEHFFVPPYVGHRGWVGVSSMPIRTGIRSLASSPMATCRCRKESGAEHHRAAGAAAYQRWPWRPASKDRLSRRCRRLAMPGRSSGV